MEHKEHTLKGTLISDNNGDNSEVSVAEKSGDDFTESIPSVSAYLKQPESLKALVANPAEFADAIAGEGADDITTNEAMVTVMLHRAEVIAQVLAPEGLAKGSSEVAGMLIDSTSKAIDTHLRGVDQIAVELSKIKRIDRDFTESVSQVRRTLRMFEDALQSRNPQDIQDVAMRANRLRDFTETYQRAIRGVKGMYDGDVGSAARRGVTLFGENEHQARKALHDINELHTLVSENPESLHFEGVEDQVVARDTQTLGEHQEACTTEAKQAEQVVGAIKRGSADILGSSEQLMRQVNNPQVLDSLTHPRMIDDSIDQLVRTLRRVAEGQMDARRARDQLGELQQVINRAVRNFEAAPDKVTRDLSLAENIQSQMTSLKRQVQGFKR